MKKINNIWLFVLVVMFISCGSSKEVYTLNLELTNGKIKTKEYKLPPNVCIFIRGDKCLVYEKANGTVYCIRRNVISIRN